MMKTRKHDDPMMTRMLKRAARARREHGIALLFTLCILSMALITAMIFSSSASTGRKVASAYVDTSAARILADGAVSRAIFALTQSQDATFVCSNYKINPPDNGPDDDYASDWIWKLEKSGLFSFNDGPLRFNPVYYDRDDPRCPSWEYVYARNYGKNKARDPIFGRFAYVAIGMTDQLNPNAIGKLDYPDYDNVFFQKRLGRWTSEPYFVFSSVIKDNKWDYSGDISPEKIRLRYNETEEGENGKGWEDLDIFINDMTKDGEHGSDKQLKMMADQYFDVSKEGDYNKFRSDGAVENPTTPPASGEAWRFPLIRNDWNSITVDEVKRQIPWFSGNSGRTANKDQTVANLINYNARWDRPPVTDREDWIHDTPSYTGNKRTPYINEVDGSVAIGGNLGFRLAQPYFPPGEQNRKYRIWYTDCTYSHDITVSVETVNMYPITGGEDGVLRVERPIIVGEIRYEYLNPENDRGNDWREEIVRFDENTKWDDFDESGSDAGYKVYTFLLKAASIGSVTTPKREGYTSLVGNEKDFHQYLKVRNVRVSVDRVVLKDSTARHNNADLALMPDDLRNGTKQFFTGTRGSGEQVAGLKSRKNVCFNAQVNDPRCNLARTDWTSWVWYKDNEKPSSADKGSLEAFNSLTAGYGNAPHDYENNRLDPVYAGNDSISTAYIRHGQMQSLWELGAIHRGTKWQTINLKCADPNITTMSEYEAGDGHLLDQIALTDVDHIQDPVVGMINLNCVAGFGSGGSPFTFKSLFTEFPVYQTYANMNKNGTSGAVYTIRGSAIGSTSDDDSMYADSYARDLSDAVTYAAWKAGSKGKRRTSILPESFSTDNSQMSTIIPRNVPDAQSEEIFSRVVNLLKWNKQQIRRAAVLVLAQTIQDTGGGVSLSKNLAQVKGSNGETQEEYEQRILHDGGFLSYTSKETDRLTTSKTASAIESKYSSRTVNFRQYDNFHDQITGEAKIIVRLEWDDSANNNKGAWIITRREYAD